MKITAQIKTNSKKESIELLENGQYLIRINTPPIEGKANQRIIELLSKELKIQKSKIHIVRGKKSKLKVFNILVD